MNWMDARTLVIPPRPHSSAGAAPSHTAAVTIMRRTDLGQHCLRFFTIFVCRGTARSLALGLSIFGDRGRWGPCVSFANGLWESGAVGALLRERRRRCARWRQGRASSVRDAQVFLSLADLYDGSPKKSRERSVMDPGIRQTQCGTARTLYPSRLSDIMRHGRESSVAHSHWFHPVRRTPRSRCSSLASCVPSSAFWSSSSLALVDFSCAPRISETSQECRRPYRSRCQENSFSAARSLASRS